MRRKTLFAIFFIVILIGVAAGYYILKESGSDKVTEVKPHMPSQTISKHNLKHIVIIVEENKPYSTIVGNKDAPYINSILKQGASAHNYSAITNPSLPNYIALTSGSPAGITNDCSPPENGDCEADVSNIADSIEKSGRTWKMYAEDMPAPCAVANAEKYAVRHNPFVYYPDIRNNQARCRKHVVPFDNLEKDIANKELPDYVFISPNLCNDMHDCPVRTGDDWLSKQVPIILKSPDFTSHESLLVITWDEGKRGKNKIPTVFLGSAARSGYVSDSKYDHYSLLRTIEAIWQLPPLTDNDRHAIPMSDMLK